ncbi:MAG TPA: hypothetical protein VGA70_02600 [Longimicrobiales bacterium]
MADQLTVGGIECYRVLFPRGLDANASALEVRPAEKSLEVLIRAATWMGTGTPSPIASPQGAGRCRGRRAGPR